VLIGALSYALYIALTCPCGGYLDCHLEEMALAVGVSAAIVAWAAS
jgi:hypothetical protein